MTDLSRRLLILAAPALILPSASILTPGRVLAALLPTPRGTEGPFYPKTLPTDQDNDLVRVEGKVREAGGDILNLAGTVVDRNGAPIPGARIEIWQCDMNGIYLHPSDRRLERRDAAFQGFGHAIADDAGKFAFRTIVPVPYSGRTPHIHVKVLKDRRELLTTQIYRAGFPQNFSDFLFRRLSPAERVRSSMIFRETGGAGRPGFSANIQIVI